ncbi:hypothetical protein [Williamsia sp.]|uniref:hypothetical protein n=1 Tax=Williamsia sp. TaxID=1872085 RepID=UPI002F94F4FD
MILGPALVAGLIAAYQNHTSPYAPLDAVRRPTSSRTQTELEMLTRRADQPINA